MPLMHWDETMSVGVIELDRQHQTLVALINESYEAIQRQDEQFLATLIDRMQAYATIHFETEEKYLRENGFPYLEDHQQMHVGFREEVEGLQHNTSKTNSSQVFIFLSRWLTNHIMEQDKKDILSIEKGLVSSE
nr:bacteriohemerythrin [uncultured Pseudodesulfovibrio sp.]